MNKIYTPEIIQSTNDLPHNAIVVVGTNFEGRHGLGGANMAMKLFGLTYGHSKGICNRTFAIITKDLKKGKRSVTIDFIFNQVIDSMEFAVKNPDKILYYTKFGSSLAGFTIEEIKNIFKEIYEADAMPNNIVLPFDYEVRK